MTHDVALLRREEDGGLVAVFVHNKKGEIAIERLLPEKPDWEDVAPGLRLCAVMMCGGCVRDLAEEIEREGLVVHVEDDEDGSRHDH